MREQYEKILSNPKTTMKQLQDYVFKNFPEKLYRYRKFGKYWRDEIFKGYVHMTKSSECNDPFDCKMNIDEKKYREYRKKTASKECKDKEMFDLIYNALEPKEREMFKEKKSKLEEMIRVCCFSEINNSILMWSHYADYHQGFCIEYDISKMKDNRIKQHIFPVAYSNNWYDATQDLLYPNKDQIWIKSCLYKYKAWEYEKEWRIIYPEEHNYSEDKYNFDFSNAITGIYLGLNTNIKQEELEEIKEWTRNKNIKLYKMKTNENKYELYSEEINS